LEGPLESESTGKTSGEFWELLGNFSRSSASKVNGIVRPRADTDPFSHVAHGCKTERARPTGGASGRNFEHRDAWVERKMDGFGTLERSFKMRGMGWIGIDFSGVSDFNRNYLRHLQLV
jgi:hypothetical protein